MTDSPGLSTVAKVIIGLLAVIGVFAIISTLFWSVWFFIRWLLVPLLIIGVLVYFLGRKNKKV